MIYRKLALTFVTVLACLGGSALGQAPKAVTIGGVTFANRPGHLYLPVRELSEHLNQSLSESPDSGGLLLGNKPILGVYRLFDGTGIVPITEARAIGATVDWNPSARSATVHYHGSDLIVTTPDKTVVIDKGQQALMAYQGARLVMRTHVSTGREGHGTPNGSFSAGPAKERMHRSRLYHFAPMPYSVQVAGNIFIHGYTSVPHQPASHGCIRMPLNGINAAKYFYNWIDIGTPVTIQGHWSYRVTRGLRHHRRSHLRYFAHRRGHHFGRFARRQSHRTNHAATLAKSIVPVSTSPRVGTPVYQTTSTP